MWTRRAPSKLWIDLDPVLPLSPGRAERHGFEYYRHGTLSLYAALETATGEVHGKTANRHTRAEFVAFLEDLVAQAPAGRDIHFIADNLSAHKIDRVRTFRGAHPQVHLHFTPTYSSWLYQVEIWFSKIERDVIARGVFTSKTDLTRKLMRYIRHYNKHAKPFKWTYRKTASRIHPGSLKIVGRMPWPSTRQTSWGAPRDNSESSWEIGSLSHQR